MKKQNYKKKMEANLLMEIFSRIENIKTTNNQIETLEEGLVLKTILMQANRI